MRDSRQAPSNGHSGPPARQQPAGAAAPENAVPENAVPENAEPGNAVLENAAAPDLSVQGAAPVEPRRRRGHRRVSTGSSGASPGAAFNLKAAEDEPAAWGDKGEDRESWLKAQRPPHWG